MILELLAYFNAKATKEARKFGHLYESIALVTREKRCRAFWLSHRTMCKEFISGQIKNANAKNSVLVLGSGPLHEIPLDLLAKSFISIDLVDVVHLKSTKKEYAHHKNVNFIEADITELEKDILKTKRIINKIPTQFIDKNYDLVISANLLSQLSYHLRNYLDKHKSTRLTEKHLDDFANQITLDHFNYLQNFNCPVILITDIMTCFLNKNDEIIDFSSPYINFSLPEPLQVWWWNLAPIPEYQKDVALKMKVAAFVLNLKAKENS